MKVSFEIAKILKEAGYPQKENQERIMRGLPECVDIPYYLEVWLWLFKEKNIIIEPKCIIDDNGGYYWVNGWVDCTYYDQEEAIAAAIEYLVENNLIK